MNNRAMAQVSLTHTFHVVCVCTVKQQWKSVCKHTHTHSHTHTNGNQDCEEKYKLKKELK